MNNFRLYAVEKDGQYIIGGLFAGNLVDKFSKDCLIMEQYAAEMIAGSRGGNVLVFELKLVDSYKMVREEKK